MTDLHVHAPQFAFRGLGMDLELLEWLNTYTFPEESKYADLEYADRAYTSFNGPSAPQHHDARGHLRHDPCARHAAADGKAGGLRPRHLRRQGQHEPQLSAPICASCQRTIPCATPNAGFLIPKTPSSARSPSLRRAFIPSCTDDLMFGLACLREQYDLPVQSHLSENYSEINWIRELCPQEQILRRRL